MGQKARHHHIDFSLDRFQRLKNIGFYPKTAIDIGASTGQWYGKFSTIYPDTRVLSVEGNPACKDELIKINPNCLIQVLGKQEGEKIFYVNKDKNEKVGASLYKENTEYYKDCDKFQLPVVTLDSLNQQFDFIKMDIQGGELDVIKGGLKTILDSSIIQLELSILNFNLGAPLASEIISYLYNIDFSFFDIASHAYWDHRLNQCDIFFVNNRNSKHLLEL